MLALIPPCAVSIYITLGWNKTYNSFFIGYYNSVAYPVVSNSSLRVLVCTLVSSSVVSTAKKVYPITKQGPQG